MHLSSPAARRAAWITLPLAVLLSGGVVATTSYAAFSATTDNGDNAWASGSVRLSDDDSDAALFDASDIVPGEAGENCIVVTADTTVDSTVKLYAADVSGGDSALAKALTMTVEQGTGGHAGDCTGFSKTTDVTSGPLSDLLAVGDFGGGLGAWTTGTAPTSTTYRFAWSLPDTAANDTQGQTVSADLVFEAQND